MKQQDSYAQLWLHQQPLRLSRAHPGMDELSSILKSPFDAQGIHNAINHDDIMHANDDEKQKLHRWHKGQLKIYGLCNSEVVTVFLLLHGLAGSLDELVLLRHHSLSAGNLCQHSIPSWLILLGHQMIRNFK